MVCMVKVTSTCVLVKVSELETNRRLWILQHATERLQNFDKTNMSVGCATIFAFARTSRKVVGNCRLRVDFMGRVSTN